MKAIINHIETRIKAAQAKNGGVNNDTLNGRIAGLELALYMVENGKASELEERASKIKGDDNFNSMRRCALIEVAEIVKGE